MFISSIHLISPCYCYDMAEKAPKTVEEIIATMEALKRNRTDISSKILELQNRLRVYDQKPEPGDFDYKEAVVAAFRAEKEDTVLKIGAIEHYISSHYGFIPEKNTLAARIGYLIDRDKERPVERVKGRRGFYRLRLTEPENTSTPTDLHQ